MNTMRGGRPVDWEKLKADLEGLSPEQLRLVLDLVEQMTNVNHESETVRSLKYSP